MSDTILQELNEGVLLLTLNRPKKKNAFNSEQWTALGAALDDARANDDVSVVVITGAGNDFSAGQDLADSISGTGGEAPYRVTEKALAAFDKPLIAAPKGVAVGGGGTVLFNCDMVYVGESLRFCLPFASLGLPPEFASSYLLQANIGMQKAAEVLFTAAWYNADQVVAAGMAVEKVADDELLNHALAKAAAIAQWPLSGLRESKRLQKLSRQQGVESALSAEVEAMGRLAGSPENVEAISAFMQKRKPDFKNLKKSS